MTPRELIHQIQLAAVKARSNAAEDDLSDVGTMVDPFLFGDDEMSLLGLSTKMLDGEPGVMDAYNLLVLIEMKSPAFTLIYFMRWDAKLPEAQTYLQGSM